MADQQMIHQLNPRLLEGPVRMLVVGCGGTGAAFASSLPYLHQSMIALGHPGGLDVTLADGDVVSASNCVRQPFNVNHIGRNKAEALITGINVFWGLRWSAIPRFIRADDELSGWDIVVGCVDSRASRALLAKLTSRARDVRYWLDAGNGPDFGQFVLGEPRPQGENTLRLPTVSELLPDTVRPGPEDNAPSCSAAEALTRQAPFVNHVLAHHMLYLLGHLFRFGKITYHGMFLNLARGEDEPIPVDPAQWDAMRGIVPAKGGRGTTRTRRRTPQPAPLPLAA